MLNLTAVPDSSAIDVWVETVQIEDVTNNTQAYATSGNCTVFVSVASRSSAIALITNQPLTYRAPAGAVLNGTWSGTLPAANLTASAAGWTYTVSFYGPLGLTDTLLHTQEYAVPNANA